MRSQRTEYVVVTFPVEGDMVHDGKMKGRRAGIFMNLDVIIKYNHFPEWRESLVVARPTYHHYQMFQGAPRLFAIPVATTRNREFSSQKYVTRLVRVRNRLDCNARRLLTFHFYTPLESNKYPGASWVSLFRSRLTFRL